MNNVARLFFGLPIRSDYDSISMIYAQVGGTLYPRGTRKARIVRNTEQSLSQKSKKCGGGAYYAARLSGGPPSLFAHLPFRRKLGTNTRGSTAAGNTLPSVLMPSTPVPYSALLYSMFRGLSHSGEMSACFSSTGQTCPSKLSASFDYLRASLGIMICLVWMTSI